MELTSPAFEDGSPIPKQYTEDGNNFSPPLRWDHVPAGTAELALIVDDPDAPRPKPFVHWVVYKIPPDAVGLPQGVPRDEELRNPLGATQGLNDFSRYSLGYRGPAPPKGHGVHRYHFHLYALDQPLTLGPGIEKDALLRAMQGHILDEAELIGTYQRA